MEQDIIKLLNENGLSGYMAIIDNALPAIRLTPSGLEDDETLPVGVSKMGGAADLPENLAWPVWHDRQLSFLVQLNLAELSRFRLAGDLPEEGLLSFFYDCQEQPWGYDPNHAGGWRVFYFPIGVDELTRKESPSSDDPLYEPFGLSFQETLTLPPSDSRIIQAINLSPDDLDKYESMMETLYEQPLHQIFGYPAQIQSEMQLECQWVSNGIYCGDATGHQHPRAQELAKKADDWLLLLQLGSDDVSEMMWGDCGRLYFWIRQQDLLERDFDKVWMILQCH